MPCPDRRQLRLTPLTTGRDNRSSWNGLPKMLPLTPTSAVVVPRPAGPGRSSRALVYLRDCLTPPLHWAHAFQCATSCPAVEGWLGWGARFGAVWLSAPPCRTARPKNTGGRPRHIRRCFPVRLTADSTRRTIPELSGATGCPPTPSRPYHPPGSWGARPMATFSYITRDADLQRATIGD